MQHSMSETSTDESPAHEPHRYSAQEVLARLQSDAQAGLSAQEASRRLQELGPNTLAEQAQPSAWRKFLAQFTDILVVLLLVAALISAGLWLVERDSALPFEALAIFAIVVLNAIMGYLQEARAERAVAALQKLSAAQATVIRDGVRQRVPAAEIVPGDLLLVEEGDTVPADARLIESVSLQMAEAALTGESQPASKSVAPIPGQVLVGDRHNMVFPGPR